MIIIINPYAAGSTAMNKWERVKKSILGSRKPGTIEILGNGRAVNVIVKDALRQNQRDFIAAGGDGTVNLVLNSIVSNATPDQLKNVRFGALGLGSSNDFHKPFAQADMIDGTPSKMRFDAVQPRDIGYVSYQNGEHTQTRYFIANASVGVTAEANHFFNNPDRLLRVLKRWNTQASIMYAALKTIACYHNIHVSLFGSWGCESVDLTNLGVVKNPHFSGDLCYQTPVVLDNGKLSVHVCHDMTRIGLLRLLWALRHGKFQHARNKRSYESDWLSLTSQEPFFVEFDGEIITATSARFGVMQKLLQVCP